jgi:hypothetical protein
MRRFIFSSGILSSLATAVALLRQSRRGPFNRKVALLWVSWGITLALEISSVLERDRQKDI